MQRTKKWRVWCWNLQEIKIFARNDVAMTSMATGSKVPSTHNIPRILHITSSPTPEAVTLQILCALSLISFGVIYVYEWKSWSTFQNILLGKEISPHAKYMNQSTSHPSANDLNRSNQVGVAPAPWCPVARAGALLLTEPNVWSHCQISTQLRFIISSAVSIIQEIKTRLWQTRSIKCEIIHGLLEIKVLWVNGIEENKNISIKFHLFKSFERNGMTLIFKSY